MTDKTNEIKQIRRARLLFEMAVDMMEDYRYGNDRGGLYNEIVEDGAHDWFPAMLAVRGWCPECDVEKTKCECVEED